MPGQLWSAAPLFLSNASVGNLTLQTSSLQNLLSTSERTRLMTEFARPIPVPCTLIWGEQDPFLSADVAKKSHEQAHCDVEWRPLAGVGHFVSIEAPDRLVAELRTVLFLTGSKNAKELRGRHRVVLGQTKEWLTQLRY